MNTTNAMATAGSSCPAIEIATKNANYTVYFILMPLRLLLGGTAQVISLIAFCKRRKNEKAYTYQIYASMAKISEIRVSVLHYSNAIFVGADGAAISFFLATI
jgi:hypothetical protein